MGKKRSKGVTLISLYLLLSGIVGYILYAPWSNYLRIVNIIFGISLVTCAVGLFNLFRWGRKATILVMVVGIIYSAIYNSPLMKDMRITELHKTYDQMTKSNDAKYYINDKEVSKEDFIANQNQKVEKMRGKGFGFEYMIPMVVIRGLIIFFLYRPKIKAQFE